MGGITRRGEGKLGRNEAVCYSKSGSFIGRYLKQRPFSGAGEDAVHEQGVEGLVFTWNDMRVSSLICYDLRFPELFRAGAKAGVELFVVIAAWPSVRVDHWVTLLRARAIENQAYVVGVNRTGEEPGRKYSGRSMVVDPHGTVLLDAGENEGTCSCEIIPHAPAEWREVFPAYRDFLRWS